MTHPDGSTGSGTRSSSFCGSLEPRAVGGAVRFAYVHKVSERCNRASSGFQRAANPCGKFQFLFSSVAAAVVGGASILGGSGGYVGTLVGAVLLTLINILLVVFSMSAGAISIFYGLTILFSVWIGSSRSSATR